MCLIIATPPGNKPVSLQKFTTAACANPDGIGLAALDSKEDRFVKKGYKTVLSAYLDYRMAVRRHSPVMVHFRFATHGKASANLCHPFLAGKDKVPMVHNGILSEWTKYTDKNWSDTRVFAEQVLREWEECHITSGIDHLAKLVGRFNKLVFLAAKQLVIINEDAGHWENGSWFSSPAPSLRWRPLNSSFSNCLIQRKENIRVYSSDSYATATFNHEANRDLDIFDDAEWSRFVSKDEKDWAIKTDSAKL